MLNFIENNPDGKRNHDTDEDEDDNNHDNSHDYDFKYEYRDNVEKLSALYKEDWKEKSFEELMDGKYFKEIPEFWEMKRISSKTVSNKDLNLLHLSQSILLIIIILGQ